MADTKISALTALTGADAATDDVAVVVDTSLAETKKMTLAEMANAWLTASFPLGSILYRGTNTLEQRNSTNAQTFNIYNTYTDASNYERGFVRWASNLLEIGTEVAGTGVNRSLKIKFGQNEGGFMLGGSDVTPILFVKSGHASGRAIGFLGGTSATVLVYDSSAALNIATDTKANIAGGLSNGGTTRWHFTSAGNFTAATDNTYDIGASGANRPRYIRAASALVSPATTVASLPAAGTAGAGARSFVTDATSTTFMSTVAGAGANAVPVVSDGTNWLIG